MSTERRILLAGAVSILGAVAAGDLLAQAGAQGKVEPCEERTESGIQLHEVVLTRQQRRHLERKAAKARRAK